MDKVKFQELLTKEVESYKTLLETETGDWIVKGFIDVHKNVYTITNDTKVVSKIIEIILIPHLDAFAKQNQMTLELPSVQNYYPDLTFKDAEGNLENHRDRFLIPPTILVWYSSHSRHITSV